MSNLTQSSDIILGCVVSKTTRDARYSRNLMSNIATPKSLSKLKHYICNIYNRSLHINSRI